MTNSRATREKNKARNIPARLSLLEKPELEEMAIASILKHRKILADNERHYQFWCSAPLKDSDVNKAEYLRRQKAADAQQNELADLIDALGYIPKLDDSQKLQ